MHGVVFGSRGGKDSEGTVCAHRRGERATCRGPCGLEVTLQGGH